MLRRPDHGLLLSMWSCLRAGLWVNFGIHKVTDAFAGSKLSQEVAAFRAEHGLAPHPYSVARPLVPLLPKQPSKKAKAKAPSSFRSRCLKHERGAGGGCRESDGDINTETDRETDRTDGQTDR